MSYLEWKLNQELKNITTFEKDEQFREKYKKYLQEQRHSISKRKEK